MFLGYLLSFVYIGIYWNHHMLQSVHQVNGKALWANMHLLFWLSLVPFATAWMGENHFSQWPTIIYGFILLMAAIAYYALSSCLINLHGKGPDFAKALGKDYKDITSLVLYILGVSLSFINHLVGFSMYTLVAIIWFIPDHRFNKQLEKK